MTYDPAIVLILHRLFQLQGHFSTLVELAQFADLSASELETKIIELRSLGYPITYSPSLGYQLAPPPDILVADEIPARAPNNPWSRRVSVFHETASTSDLALTQGGNGAGEGTCFIARTQTAGRGRHGRSWDSQSLGLWFSFVLRPAWLNQTSHRLTMLVSVAIVQAIEKLTHLPCRIKWPNDLILKERKLAGILIEIQNDADQRSFASVGIGANVNHTRDDFPAELRDRATSLHMATGLIYRRIDLFIEMWNQLYTVYQQPFEEILAAWRERCASIGQPITLQDGVRTLTGTMLDLTPEGAILLRTPAGTVEAVYSGEMIG